MNFLSIEQFVQVCEMQNALNTKTAGADWTEQNLAWSTATFAEAAEAMNHLGWEWWKATEPNLAQAKLEVIDILHFTISGLVAGTGTDYVSSYASMDRAFSGMAPEQLVELERWDVIHTLKEVALNTAVDNYGFAVFLTVQAAYKLGMSPNDVYNMYIGKNVLNQFRKANGYKDGTYIKMWDGKEDNECLTEIMNTLSDAGITATPEHLTERLSHMYESIKSTTQH